MSPDRFIPDPFHIFFNRVRSGPSRFKPGSDDNVGSAGIVRVNQEPIHSIFSSDGKFRRGVTWTKRREPLGSGSYGTVYEGLTDDGIIVAVKEVSLLDQGSRGKQSVIQLEQEISLLSQFEHDNIVQYLGTHKDETKLSSISSLSL